MFETYKDKHKNETAYLFGSGPTVEHFKTEDHSGMYVGVNDIYFVPKIKDKLNYLLTEKYFPELETLPDDLVVFHCNDMKVTKPNSFKYRFHLTELSDVFNGTSDDITKRFNGVSAMIFHGFFFTLYTGCKKIYLVGCDCTSKHRCSSLPNDDGGHKYNAHTNGWRFVKEYVSQNHPDVEIININPVNLKDMFPSIYTDDDSSI